MTLIERISRPGPKKLLAIDGGGIRGVLALAILQKIEDLLRKDSGRTEFRLAHYFDYISGTSTGGIVAACLSRGSSTTTATSTQWIARSFSARIAGSARAST